MGPDLLWNSQLVGNAQEDDHDEKDWSDDDGREGQALRDVEARLVHDGPADVEPVRPVQDECSIVQLLIEFDENCFVFPEKDAIK